PLLRQQPHAERLVVRDSARYVHGGARTQWCWQKHVAQVPHGCAAYTLRQNLIRRSRHFLGCAARARAARDWLRAARAGNFLAAHRRREPADRLESVDSKYFGRNLRNVPGAERNAPPPRRRSV